jgi:bifunctional non-homologous end joining protein LigD
MPESRDYAAKRTFSQTPEPPPEVAGDVDPGAAVPGDSFVIHQHHARRLHFDLRLEMFNGRTPVLVSWAVPKNLPIEKGVRSLAVHVEDHPFEYGSFSGSIPAGNYGAGEVRIFDNGAYELLEQAKGKLTFRLKGRRLKGIWHLIQTKGGKDWLVMLRSWEGDEPDPVPTGPPMEPGRTSEAFDDRKWAFEPRLEGRRAFAVCEYRTTNLLSSELEALIVPGMDKLHERVVGVNAVLDGVISGPKGEEKFVATDLLYLDGRSLTDQPYRRRRELLEESVVPGGLLGTSTSIPKSGKAVLKAAKGLGLAGVIAKRLDSTYQPGASDDWVEIPG